MKKIWGENGGKGKKVKKIGGKMEKIEAKSEGKGEKWRRKRGK